MNRAGGPVKDFCSGIFQIKKRSTLQQFGRRAAPFQSTKERLSQGISIISPTHTLAAIVFF
jgi:hypothetical protein